MTAIRCFLFISFINSAQSCVTIEKNQSYTIYTIKRPGYSISRIIFKNGNEGYSKLVAGEIRNPVFKKNKTYYMNGKRKQGAAARYKTLKARFEHIAAKPFLME